MSDLILASASPRRRELLAYLFRKFEIQAADIDETPLQDEAPEPYVERMAKEKALAVSALNPKKVVLGSDTAVILKGQILGKPQNKEDALSMLGQLSGHWHQVFTAVCVAREDSVLLETVITRVKFTEVSRSDAEDYWQTGEPQDKAGSYAIQGIGGKFVEKIEGSVSAVVGLPLCETNELLKRVLTMEVV